MKLLSSFIINALGILVLLIPLWLVGRKNTSISMKPFKSGFYTYAWCFESNKIKILHGPAYAKGAEIGTPQGDRFKITKVTADKYLLGLQERFDFETQKI